MPRPLDAALLACLTLAAGCADGGDATDDDADDAPLASGQQALAQDNGMRLNGMRLNGMRLNGMRLNGMRLNGMRLNGMRLNGSVLGGVAVTVDRRGREVETWVEGRQLVGAVLDGELEDGRLVPLRVDAVERSDAPGDRDVYYHTVSVYDAAAGRWSPSCGLDEDGAPVPAIAVAGVWDMSEGTATGGSHASDPSRFTFGCADTAIGKCVEWGYKPWKSVTRCEGGRHGECWVVPGADYHQTCTRLARADYCGDGRSSTSDGTPINVYDDVGIEERDDEQRWTEEAEWNPDGAVCVTAKGPLRHDPVPACAEALRERRCGVDRGDWPAETLIKTDLLKARRGRDGRHDDR